VHKHGVLIGTPGLDARGILWDQFDNVTTKVGRGRWGSGRASALSRGGGDAGLHGSGVIVGKHGVCVSISFNNEKQRLQGGKFALESRLPYFYSR